MRVPPIGTFGKFGAPKVSIKLPDKVSTGFIKPIKQDTVSFGSTAQYLKKYVTLPDEIKRVLSPEDAIDMFKDMDWLAKGKPQREALGESSACTLYENPWLDGYYLLVFKTPYTNGKVIIYSDEMCGDTVWQDRDNERIQLIKKEA